MKPSFQIFSSEFGVRSACPPHGFGRRAQLPFTWRSKSHHASRITHHVIAATLLFAFFALLHSSTAGEPFLQPFPNFIAIDSAVDSAGNTYLLSKAGAIKKLDPNGLEITVPQWKAATNTLPGDATSIHFSPADAFLYVSAGSTLYKYASDTGTNAGSWFAGAGITLRSVTSYGNNLYTCGDYGGVTIITFTLPGFGTLPIALGQYDGSVSTCVAFKIPNTLPTSVTFGTDGIALWGYRGANTANSIVLDEAGNAYIGGKLGTDGSGQNLKDRGVAGLDFTVEGNQGYILKWNNTLSAALDIYVPQGTANYGTYGGEVYELVYKNGFLYSVDFWTDVADVIDVHPPGDPGETLGRFETVRPGDRSMPRPGQGHPDIEILKLDTTLRLNARATVKAIADIKGRSITVDESGNVYFLGTYGPGTAYLIGPADRAQDAANAGDYYDSQTPARWGTISAPTTGSDSWYFLAKLSPSMNFQWVKTPDAKGAALAFPADIGRVRWNPRTQRVYWSGFANGTLTMGNTGAELDPPLSGPNGFLAVFEPGGDMTERVKLTILSEFGESGTQIKPWGGPTTNTATRRIIKNSTVTASVPEILYRAADGTDITLQVTGDQDQIDQSAETRITSVGYSINDSVPNGAAHSYTFTINEDTELRFNWAVEYALRIGADRHLTFGTPGNNGTVPSLIPGLSSDAAGNPVPEVKKHWIKKDDTVIAQIDGEVLDLSTFPGLPLKYVVTGFNASGPANKDHPDSDKNHAEFFAFPHIEQRQQIPLTTGAGTQQGGFVMSSPATVTYQWKLAIGIQASTTSDSSSLLPRVHVTQNPGGTTPLQADGMGSGVFFFDQHTKLQIGAMDKQQLIQLSGWFNGDGFLVTPATGAAADIPNAFSLTFSNGVTNYLSFPVDDLMRPAKIIWNYGDRGFAEIVAIGDYVTLSGVDDPTIRARIRSDLPPTVSVILGPQGSTGDDMGLWDDVAKRYLPLRPGTLRLSWKTTDADPNARIAVTVTAVYPTLPHFRHIANSAPVDLDPDPNDAVTFLQIKYTDNGAAIGTTGPGTANGTQSKFFSASNPGNSVLLFTETSSVGRAGKITTYRVRVVNTRLYDSDGPPVRGAVIGQRIRSTYDTAGLSTGFLFNQLSRYNAILHDRDNVSGPIFPVNLHPSAGKSEKLVVVWYEIRDKIFWPYQAEQFTPRWPTIAEGLNRIVIASRFGNECVDTNGNDQLVADDAVFYQHDEDGTITNIVDLPPEYAFNPSRLQQLAVYSQADPSKPGYNPNEEHAVIAPSLRSAAISPRPSAVYALRDGDLNVTTRGPTYTSDPYVLVQFFDVAEGDFKMKVYSITRKDTNLAKGYRYEFEQSMEAGEPVIPFYPLVQVIGATPCPGTYGKDGAPDKQVTFWKDHKETGWAISGNGFFNMFFFYPLQPDFYWPPNSPDPKQAGDCVAWLPDSAHAAYSKTNFTFNADGTPFDYRRDDQTPPFQGVKYSTVWPDNVAVLKVGETLTFPGGEYHTDNPTIDIPTDDGGTRTVPTEGLPGALAWASGEVVFDSWNPTNGGNALFTSWTTRIIPALEERTVGLSIDKFPSELQPANKRTTVKDGKFVFNELSSSLQKRISYDPIVAKLSIVGFLNDKGIGDTTLTAPPPAVYVLEPNILTDTERQELDALADEVDWKNAVSALYNLCRNPNAINPATPGADGGYRVGLEQKIIRNANGEAQTDTDPFDIISLRRDATKAAPVQALGPGLAVVANPDFLDPLKDTPPISYVTLVENNHPSLGSAPVALHIIKVDRKQRYRGAIKTVLSANVFDENIVLRHTGDFGTHADDLVFEWWYRPEDGTDALPPDKEPARWKVFGDPSGNLGRNFYQLKLKGNPSAPEVLLADTLFFVRYRHKNDPHSGTDWTAINPYPEWAGAGNSSPKDLNEDGIPDYRPQLAEGWVKRVLDAVNPYEARIRDFEGDNPATASTLIRQLGPRFEGPVALNPDKNVIENVGLIELYETIFKRARDLSIDLSTPISTAGISTALQLASTRLADFYALLGNEAYTDALNPTIGIGSGSTDYGNQAPAVFAFQNQVSSLLEEEIALLRGQDDFKARPVYSRLFWNFTKGEGEVAYAINYNIHDVNNDGFIDENDAMILYPQGHGDAWGHYLTALTHQYDLLRHPYFNWVSRSELYNLQDIVIPVDFLDERKFAEAAAAKAKVGADIVNMTYRSKYVEQPDSQWQGYTDTDKRRAWGLDEWAKRAGQGAYFDWVTANALLPAHHPNTNFTGIQKIDRTTVDQIATIGAGLVAVQDKLDEANNGSNPLGLENGALTFDIDPTFLYVGSTAQIGTRAVQGLLHFDQIFERALQALKNAKAVFDYANQSDNMLRQVADNEEDFRREVFNQDLAYRNQLIEIFGSPYEGAIGAGKAYPPGYLGPDTMLYMYADVRDINSRTVPQPSAAFTNAYISALGSGSSIIPGLNSGFLRIDNSWRKDLAPTFAGNQSDFFPNFQSNAGVDGYLDPAYAGGVALTNIILPITAAGYTFQAPPEWGIRRSPGELQTGITEMLQAQAALAIEISNYGSWQSDILRTIQLINARYDMNATLRDAMIAQIIVDSAIDATSLTFKFVAAGFEIAALAIEEDAAAAAEAIPKEEPIVGLAVGPGDALSAIRGVLKLTGELGKEALTANKIVWEKLADVADKFKDLNDKITETIKSTTEKNFELKAALKELQDNIVNDNTRRLEIFNKEQALRAASEKYRAALGKGLRLIQERTAYNKKIAAMTQQHRYQDVAFRFSRNAALEKYRSAFDLAARYTYLAATAYDYDTNLGQDDAGSPVDIRADIIRQRTLGVLNLDNQPAMGAGGLAEDLAWLKNNYDTLKFRMGLNNPQLNSTTFSLRHEYFRCLNTNITSDDAWRATLRTADIYKTNLWTLPQFRAYCRPFSSETNGPQPGLVITFGSQITPNKNFFGWPLGGGDNSYDPSLFNTKIVQAGIWFFGYDGSQLAATPRVYLIPVGQDVMTIPTSRDLAVRVWNVLDAVIPVPFPSVSGNLNDPSWKPLTDSLAGPLRETKRFSSFLAGFFDHEDLDSDESAGIPLDYRLVGRSAWNTRWMLIIPGATLNSDPDAGLQTFIDNLEDIKLVLNTYGSSGN